MLAADFHTLATQQAAQHSSARERVLQVQRVDGGRVSTLNLADANGAWRSTHRSVSS